MTKSEILFQIGETCPDFAGEILALLKRLDKEGNFHGPAKWANEKRLAKLCRDALETGEFTSDISAELKKIESTLAGPGRPAIATEDKRRPRSIKMNNKEWQELQRRASEAGISVAEYIRIKALGK